MSDLAQSAAQLLRLGSHQAAGGRFFDFAQLLGAPRELVPLLRIEPRHVDSAIDALAALRENLPLGVEREIIDEATSETISERLDALLDFLGRDSAKQVASEGRRLDSVCIALTQIRQVQAMKGVPGDNGRRVRLGWQLLDDYFSTAFGSGYTQALQRVVKFRPPSGHKDTLPAWCGVFCLWGIRSAGVETKSWKTGHGIASILKQTNSPRPGDVAFLQGRGQHMCLVVDVTDTELISIDGNTNSAAAATGGQIGVKRRPRSKVLGFFSQRTPVA